MRTRLPFLAVWQAQIQGAREAKLASGDAWLEDAQFLGKQNTQIKRSLVLAAAGMSDTTPLPDGVTQEALEAARANWQTPEGQAIVEKILSVLKGTSPTEKALDAGSFMGQLAGLAAGKMHSLSNDESQVVAGVISKPESYKPKSLVTEAKIQSFLGWQREHGTASKTVAHHQTRLRAFAKWQTETEKPIDWDSVVLWLQSLVSITSKTKQQYLFSCSAFWKWAIAYDHTLREVWKGKPNPFEGHTLPKARRGTPSTSYHAFSRDEVQNLYAQALVKKDQSLADLILIGAYTGCRLEEIGRIQSKHVHEEGGTKYFQIDDAKTRAGIRAIPVHPALLSRFNMMLHSSTDGFLISGMKPDKHGNRLPALGKRFGRLKKAAGFSEAHVFHSIRKTVTTLLHRAGADHIVMTEILGHEVGQMTFDIYSDGASLQQKAQVIDLLYYDFSFPAEQNQSTGQLF
nr:tyrosine-type recombinase/integrase [Pseudomonas sp. MS19]